MAPKWRDLADRLAEQIRNGEYAPGDQLPQIRELVESGEGSKATVNQAYKALETEGLVTSTRGRGTVVRPRTPSNGSASLAMTRPNGATVTRSRSSLIAWHPGARTTGTSRRRRLAA